MFNILVDSHIPHIKDFFLKYFHISYFDNVLELQQNINKHDILICRATTNIDENLISNSKLKIVATASSGHDHIDHHALEKYQINFFSGHGANARAVCDYITSTLAYLIQKKILASSKQIKVAIIGYGAVGCRVFQRLHQLNFLVGVYDPLKMDVPNQINLDDFKNFDVICLHPSYHQNTPFPSHHMINASFIKNLSSNVCIINAARGKVVDEQAILASNFKGLYCTDVYWNEPIINPEIVARSTLCTPHIAGHTLEGKQNMTKIVSEKIHQYLKLPFVTELNNNKTIPLPTKTWINDALELYNPAKETQQLKQNPSHEGFLKLRKAHKFRHDFPWLDEGNSVEDPTKK